MTTSEAAKRLGVTDRRVLQFIGEKRLVPVRRMGRLHILRASDVERLARELVEDAPRKRGPKPNVLKQQSQPETPEEQS